MIHRYDKTYYERNKEHVKEVRRKFRKDHPDIIKRWQANWYLHLTEKRFAIKVDILTYYGNGKLACIRCGFADIRALTLDHIVPVGSKNRIGLGHWLYRKLQALNYPEGYQTLCANCQLIKMFEGNEWTTKH